MKSVGSVGNLKPYKPFSEWVGDAVSLNSREGFWKRMGFIEKLGFLFRYWV